MDTIRLRAGPESLEKARDFVCAQAAQTRLPEDKRQYLDLAVEEIVVNQIHYACRSPQDEIMIECYARRGSFYVRFSDAGPAFNPLLHPPPDTSAPLEERPIGGLGIHLVRQIADRLTYRRRDGRNWLTVTFGLDLVSGGP